MVDPDDGFVEQSRVTLDQLERAMLAGVRPAPRTVHSSLGHHNFGPPPQEYFNINGGPGLSIGPSSAPAGILGAGLPDAFATFFCFERDNMKMTVDLRGFCSTTLKVVADKKSVQVSAEVVDSCLTPDAGLKYVCRRVSRTYTFPQHILNHLITYGVAPDGFLHVSVPWTSPIF
ncbi:hypothetical protein AAG570_011997 [Ranatra chinensis]|uniref:SHSP domain-containing protein n=1 Tax=Ranatra chinensis TaxID=642074 RepID=A0ABD0YHJ1_9HEMI